jgi:hypothetical protein
VQVALLSQAAINFRSSGDSGTRDSHENSQSRASLSINDGGDGPDVEALKAATHNNHRSSMAEDHDHMMMRSPRMDLPAPGHHQEGDAKDDAKKVLDP